MNQLLRDMLAKSSGSITVKSQAMAPLAWFCGILVPAGTAGLIWGPPNFAWAYLALLGFSMLLYAGFYAYWAVKDPNRLGSEAFVERSEMRRILELSKDPSFVSTTEAPLLVVPDPHPPATRTKELKP